MELILDEQAIERSWKRVAHEVLERNPDPIPIGFIGIQTRGVALAQRLHSLCHHFDPQRPTLPPGKLDISFHRDDINQSIAIPKETDIPFDINDQQIVLVDDVLFTGRTVRAALNAMLDLGRTRGIQLAVLVDRGHRQLPIRADYVGKNIPTSKQQNIVVRLKEFDKEEKEAVWVAANNGKEKQS